MDSEYLIAQSKRVNINRNFTLECLRKTMPKIVEKIESERYFIATTTIQGRPDDFYTIIDTNSKQVEHIFDFDEHCVKIYNSLLNALDEKFAKG